MGEGDPIYQQAADLFQDHAEELGFISRAQCREDRLLTVERDGRVVGAALINHCERKPQTTLYDIAVDEDYRRQGIALELIKCIAAESPHNRIIAKCPCDLPSNEFYQRTGWSKVGQEHGKERPLNVWELSPGT